MEFVWNEAQAEDVRARNSQALERQVQEFNAAVVRFNRRAEELEREAARLAALPPVMMTITYEWEDSQGGRVIAADGLVITLPVFIEQNIRIMDRRKNIFDDLFGDNSYRSSIGFVAFFNDGGTIRSQVVDRALMYDTAGNYIRRLWEATRCQFNSPHHSLRYACECH